MEIPTQAFLTALNGIIPVSNTERRPLLIVLGDVHTVGYGYANALATKDFMDVTFLDGHRSLLPWSEVDYVGTAGR